MQALRTARRRPRTSLGASSRGPTLFAQLLAGPALLRCSSSSSLSSLSSSSSSSLHSLRPPPPARPPPPLLPRGFVADYARRAPPFGFNGLGEFVYATRYARARPDGTKEVWHETVERVVNGTFGMQRRWLEQHGLGWDGASSEASARAMYDAVFRMRFLPPGRGLWAMGSPMTEERGMFAALNNCAFVSTADVARDPPKPFCFLMDAAMLGVGVGFDTAGAGAITVRGAVRGGGGAARVHAVADSREGWVASLHALLHAHFAGAPAPAFDYSLVRPRGAPILGFGGTASGPGVLQRLHEDVDATLAPLAGKALTVTAIVDVMNQIGRCIVSGDVRQTAEIAFGSPNDPEYVALKDYRVNPQRAAWGWTSNNSVFATLGMDYEATARSVAHNGEPGFAWLENMRAFGRMCDPPNHKDARAMGGNPCLEQTLESYELCCLVETFPANHDSLEEFADTLRLAMMYAKTVTLGRTHWTDTNRVLLRNRRIGCSVSGVAQFIARRGLHELRAWCDAGYTHVQAADAEFSDAFAVPRSIKTTCVKPSGTVSLLAGATPGMHFPESRYYLRRVRLGAAHELVPVLLRAGFAVEPAQEDPGRKVVVTFPVDAGAGVRTLDSVSMWEQFSLAALLQRHWADNQVSCTVTFDPAREGPAVARALDYFQYALKGVSLLPRAPKGAYAQMPYEAISGEQYAAAVRGLKPLHLARGTAAGSGPGGDPVPDLFCDSEACAAPPPPPPSPSL